MEVYMSLIILIKKLKLQIGLICRLVAGHRALLCFRTLQNHIDELNKYSWDEKKTDRPEDAHDHTINASQYAWIPYRTGIGLQPYNNK